MSMSSLEAASSSGRTLFFNASVVHTVSPTAPSAAAWCVIDGAFSGVGSLAVATAACGASAARVNLHGAVVVPGLIDSHLHLLYGGLKLARPQLDNASSAAEVVSILLAHVAKRPVPPGGWLQGVIPGTRSVSRARSTRLGRISTAPFRTRRCGSVAFRG